MKYLTKRIMGDLGTLLTPTTLVAVFCQAIGVDPQRTAVYSIAAVIFVTCCYYRAWISATLSSAFVLAISIGLGTIFFFNYSNILLKDTGLIKRYQKSSEMQGDVGAQISAARNEIWFFGTDFHVSSGDQRQRLLEALGRGVRIRYLVLNPYVPQIETIAMDFDQSVQDLREECIAGIRDMLELKKRWETTAQAAQNTGELEIRFYSRTPSARMYAFDPSDASGRTMYVPYMHGVNSPELPGYLFQNTPSGVAVTYQSAVKKLWSNAQPLDRFLSEHQEYSPAVVRAAQ